MQPVLSSAVERAAAWYRECHYWPVHVVEDAIFLPLGRGVVAFEAPAARAKPVQDVLERSDLHTAALLVKRPFPRVTFLAEADDSVLGQYQMPFGVRYLPAPAVLQVPLLTPLQSDGRSWFHTPDPARRWFPRAAAVLAAIIAATPYAVRACTSPARTPRRERVVFG